MQNRTRKQCRQGDILLEHVNELPTDAKPQPRVPRLVVARGEATGHHHVRSTEAGRLMHEEHGAIEILTDPTFIVCRRQIEFTANLVAQQVAD